MECIDVYLNCFIPIHESVAFYLPLIFQSLAVTICTINIKVHNFYIFPQNIYIFCKCRRKNIEVFPMQSSKNGFHTRGGECLLRGKTWANKYNGQRLVLKWLSCGKYVSLRY